MWSVVTSRARSDSRNGFTALTPFYELGDVHDADRGSGRVFFFYLSFSVSKFL